MQPLELAGERHIAIKDGANRYYFTLAAITPAQWMKCFAAIVNKAQNRNEGKERVVTSETTLALVELATEALTGAEGYTLPQGVAKLSDMADWKTHIPFGHRRALGMALNYAVPMAADEAPAIAIGDLSVRLQALWNEDKGVMPLHRPLVHHFAPLGFEHERKFLLADGRSVIVGGSRTGETQYAGTHRELVEIYDDLIQSVEGYTANGAELNVADIVKWMSTPHKVVAARQLFNAPPLEPEEEVAAA